MAQESIEIKICTKKGVEGKKETVINQFIAAIICSLLAYMDGMSISWPSSALPQLESGDSGGWVGGVFCLGALVSSPFFGVIADKRGRKTTGFLVAICFSINWILILSSKNVGCVLTARVFAGAGAAGAITVPYIYNTEVAIPRLRAVLVGMLALFFSIGAMIAYALGPNLSYDGVAGVNVGITLLFFPLWWIMPESPSHLILKDKQKEALKALTWLLGSSEVAEDSLKKLVQEQAGAVNTASLSSFFKDRGARKAIWICAVMVTVQSFSGILAVNSYAETIFNDAGGALSPMAGTMVYGVLMILGALVPPVLADRAPRKVLLSASTLVMALAMGAMGIQQMFPSATSPVPTIALGISIFSFTVGLGSILFVVIGEIFTHENRGLAGSILVTIVWITCFFLLQFFGIAVKTFGDHVVFFFFAGVCLFGAIFCMMFIPETRGRSPQEVVAILLGEKTIKKTTSVATIQLPSVTYTNTP